MYQTVSRLGVDDVHQREALGQHHDADHRQAHGDLVRDELGGGAGGAEQAVLVAARPAAQDQAVEAEAGEGEQEQHADVQVGARPGRPCGPKSSIEPPNGITATAATAANTEIIGAIWKSSRLAPCGTKSSLKISFTTSASGWR